MMHFQWDEEAATTWFDMSDEEQLKLGVHFDLSIMDQHPETNQTLLSTIEAQDPAYCMICYEAVSYTHLTLPTT